MNRFVRLFLEEGKQGKRDISLAFSEKCREIPTKIIKFDNQSKNGKYSWEKLWRTTNYGFDAARMCEQLQRSFTLRGADAITDHGAENVDTVQRTSTEIFPRPLVLFLCFVMASQPPAPERIANY